MTTTPPDDSWPTRDDDTVVRSSAETVVQPAPAGPPPDEPGHRIGLGMLLAILFLALIAAAALAVWLLTRNDNKKQTTTVVVTTAPTTPATGKVAVPRVVGMKEPQALARLAEVGLRPKETYKPTKQPKSVVVAQKPQEATEVKRGSQVTIVIDSGAPKVAVPDVTGGSAAEAQAKLDAAGLDSTQTQVTSDKPAGTVVDQAPKPDAKVTKGSVVTLSVAKAAPVAVPDVVGKSEADATSALEGAGLKANPVSVPGTPKGAVKAQRPAAGAQAAKGSAVRINVADGSGGGATTSTSTSTTSTSTQPAPQPTSATVPDLSGQTLQQAVQALGGAGLLASIQYIPGTDPLGTIEQQSPAAGQTAKTRSHVTINASSGPGQKEQKSVPDATGQTLQQAVATMNAAGLRLIYQKLPVTTRAQAGKVVEQTPLAGKQAPQNAQVLVYLGAFSG